MAEQIVVELASVAPRERLIAGEAAPMQVRMNFCAEVADRRQEGTAHVLLTERVDSLAAIRKRAFEVAAELLEAAASELKRQAADIPEPSDGRSRS